MQGHMIAFRAAMTRKGEMEKSNNARPAEPVRRENKDGQRKDK